MVSAHSTSLRSLLRGSLTEPSVDAHAFGCLLIAEIAQAHDGSLGTAHAYIDAVADAGADAIKFQTHIASAESTASEPWRVRFSPQDETRFDYWRRMEFTVDQWRGLKEHADERGLVFLSSAFSPEAVELLDELGMSAWKVASGEVANQPLLRKMVATGKPLLVSTGLATLEELDPVLAEIAEAGVGLGVLQCTTAYPCPAEQVGLEQLDVFRARWSDPASPHALPIQPWIGLSDHSGTVFPGLAATTLGADVLEVHVTFHRQSFGPDVPASVTLEELTELARGMRFIERMRAGGVDKTRVSDELDGLRTTFGRSLVATRDLAAGARLTQADVAAKKPGGGLPPKALDQVIGRRLLVAVERDQPLHREMLEPTAELLG